MSEKLTKALEFSNYRTTLNNQHEILKAKVTTLLTYSNNGGTFKIDQSLISFVKYLIDLGEEQFVLIDVHENPVMITDPAEFLDEITSRYFEATNEYHVEYTKLRKNRSVKKLLELDDE